MSVPTRKKIVIGIICFFAGMVIGITTIWQLWKKASRDTDADIQGGSGEMQIATDIDGQGEFADLYEELKTVLQRKAPDGTQVVKVENINREIKVCVNMDNADTSMLSYEYIVDETVGILTDEILRHTEYDSIWDVVTVDFGDFGYVTYDKSYIVESDFGRYFEPADGGIHTLIGGDYTKNFEQRDALSQMLVLEDEISEIVGAENLLFVMVQDTEIRISFYIDEFVSRSEMFHQVAQIMDTV